VAKDNKLQKVSLAIDAQGNVSLENVHLSDEGLSNLLKDRALDPNFQLQIQADTAVNYGRVAQVMAIAQKSGVTKLSFLTIAGK
jgi:biopolymer transport protein ExbD